MIDLETLEVKDWLVMNVRLQHKKNALRKDLAERGVMQKGGTNTFDHYNYFTEAQYKLLFTELFSKYGLELKFDEDEYTTFEGSEKQANGRMVKIVFTLCDTETGFFERTTITGEGIDKGDKAGYKAYTGALKYFLANTFMVATGDDAEKESPQNTMNQVNRTRKQPTPQAAPYIPQQYLQQEPPQEQPQPVQISEDAKAAVLDRMSMSADEPKASPKQVEILRQKYTGMNLEKLLTANGVSQIEDIPLKKASELIEKIMRKEASKGE